MKNSISVIVLTYNEEINLEDCLSSVKDFAQEIFIIDSYSTDKTILVAEKFSAKVYQHTFETQAKQLNWALKNLPIVTEWVLRMDADERVTTALKNELMTNLNSVDKNISGIYIKRRVYFMDKWIKFGGYYPIWLLRIWRNRKGYSEDRLMDEHVRLLSGESCFFKGDFEEKNKKDLSWWINKHDKYATREAIEMINLKYGFLSRELTSLDLFGSQELKKKWVKENLYVKLPLFLRALLYFLYRYIFRLGFLDGKEGLIWHFLQGLWYRFLVDAKIYEIEKRASRDKKLIPIVIRELYGINL